MTDLQEDSSSHRLVGEKLFVPDQAFDLKIGQQIIGLVGAK